MYNEKSKKQKQTKRQEKRKLKEKQRGKAFQKVKLKRKAEKVEENRAKNETFKMEKEIQKIRNKEAQTTYKKDA